MKPTLFIIRGLPNTGKTETAKMLAPTANAAANDFLPKDKVLTSDDFEISHKACRRRIEKWLVANVARIAVHNTFTRISEMQPYIQMAHKYGYNINVVECKTHFEGNENGHNVPKDIVKRYAERWEPYTPSLVGGFKF